MARRKSTKRKGKEVVPSEDISTEPQQKRFRASNIRERTPNKHRRAERRRLPNSAYRRKCDAKRVAQANKYSPHMVALWVCYFKALVTRREATLNVLRESLHLPPIEVVKKLVAVERSKDWVDPIADNDPVWPRLEPIAEMLVEMAWDPLHFDHKKWVEEGVLVQDHGLVFDNEYFKMEGVETDDGSDSESDGESGDDEWEDMRDGWEDTGDDEDGMGMNERMDKGSKDRHERLEANLHSSANELSCSFYYQIAVLDDGAEAFMKYAEKNPGDLGFATFILVAVLGVDPKQVEERVSQNYGVRHSQALKEFFDVVTEMFPNNIEDWRPVVCPYAGTSIAGNPLSRCQNDSTSLHRRIVNVIKANTGEITWYPLQISNLSIPVANTLEYRTNRMLGDIEGCLIDVTCQISLNSARGGWIPNFLPPVSILKTCANALQMAGSPSPIYNEDSMLTSKLRAHVDDSVAFLRGKIGGRRINPHTLEFAKKNLADVLPIVNGSVIKMTVAKDITAEDFDGRVGGIRDATAGHAFQVDRRIGQLLDPTAILEGDLSIYEIQKYFGPTVDLWAVTLLHRWLLLHFLLLSRNLITARPILLVTWSSLVSMSMFHGEFREVWLGTDTTTSEYREARDAFMTGSSKGNIKVISPTATIRGRSHDIYGSDFLDVQGEPMLRPYGLGESDAAIWVAIGDPGHIKYDPFFAKLRLTL
ncbi:hypothetical protein JAAARDRAFT_194119 [Jaapia argillacea MUCL 33604]|uniref:Uncharacterized protein n=1 Tax=Jaapia argillacea MUCL 33604 TaxID=933084 RepID=A0A067PSW9_9AGAM|nr:hypothetical protein JAAARDRAFT_194119 [Jaapia argillacea MUCL 33604]